MRRGNDMLIAAQVLVMILGNLFSWAVSLFVIRLLAERKDYTDEFDDETVDESW
jgi:hypothetical protein